MKRNNLFIYVCLALLLTSCIKELEKTYTGKSVAEIDGTVLNSTAAGLTYPVVSRHLPDGRALSTTLDSTLRRVGKTTRVRINLVGPQSAKDETVGYTIFSKPTSLTTYAFPATITGQTPSKAAATLNVADAVAGTHYTALNGKVTIPANSSFGYIDIQLLNSEVANEAKFIGIKLDSTGTILPSLNYRYLGLVIDQR